MALHRYWRIHITESTSGSNVLISLYEVELRATPGGPDQCNGGSVFASHADANAYKLFDDNNSSYWVNGAPSAPTWFQYDFGVGNSVDVAEVRLLPRYSSQSPKAFSLQYSDDALDWFVATSWADVTDWVGGVEKLFVPPSPPAMMASAQKSQPFALSVAATCSHAYVFGTWLRTEFTETYALYLEAARQQPWSQIWTQKSTQFFGHWLECSRQQSFGLLVSNGCSQSWKRFLRRALIQPFHAQVNQSRMASWSLYHRLVVDSDQRIVTTWRVVKSSGRFFSLQLRNAIAESRCGYWNLSVPQSILCSVMPALRLDGLPLPFVSASITYKPEQMLWSAQLRLALDADFGRMALDDPFVLQVGGESFELIVDGKRLDRPGPDQVERVLYGVSPTARHDFPRAATVTGSWNVPVWARDVVEALLGEAVIWELPEWRIHADRLAVRDLSPIQVVQKIIEAAGGVVQTQPSGGLSVRPRFPHAVPTWSGAVPLHVLTDESDILAIREVRHARVRVDRVIVRDGAITGQRTHFGIHLDQQEDGPNQGRTQFSPGETTHLLVTSGQDVNLSSVTASAGRLMAAMPTTWQQTEDLSFTASNRAVLATPTIEIVSVLWLGTDLGLPVLQADGVTLLTPVAGTAIARITYTVAADRYPFTTPHILAGEENFPVLFAATGHPSDSGILKVTAQRGNAIYPMLEVVSPLLSDYRALRSRAQAELDQGEALQEVELTIVHRPGLEAGQLIEVQDGFYGRSFRALIVGVHHEIDVKGWVSRLTLLKG